MKTARFESLDQVSLPEKPLHLAIGMFDGLHLGHQSVIDSAIRAARNSNSLAGVLTFWPHPSELFRSHDPTPQIMGPEMKEKVLAAREIDLIITQPFTREFASVEAEAFLPLLQRRLPRLTAVYVGENWRFGKGRKGDVAALIAEGKKHHLTIVKIPRLLVDGEPVSSTRIRECLADGQIEVANTLLGYPYFCEGIVTAGKGVGRQIGFPTLNILWHPSLQPRHGVYAVRVRAPSDSSRQYPAVANYGLRPTVGNHTSPLLETHLLGHECPFSAGSAVRVEWLHFLRPEKRFSGLDQLKAQIARDKEKARSLVETD